MSESLWWGTYPPLGLGTPVGQGEGLYLQHGPDAALALALDAPSFVVAHPSLPLIYAVSESSKSSLHVIDVSGAAARVAVSVATGGVDACHILLAPDAGVAYVSHYGSGEVAVVRLGEDGLPVDGSPQQLLGHTGSGPREDRQEGPHAHFAGYAPGGRHVLVADLGTDELRRYLVLEDGLLEPDGIGATLPPGSGPRHFAVRGENIYLVCELDHQLRTLRWSPGDAEADVIAEVPTTRAPQRTGDDIYDAHVTLVGEDVLLPPDLEALLALPGGNIFHGAMSLDALWAFRPAPGWARYRTPLHGLYLGGAGAHPGGGVMGAPGRNAARVILRDTGSGR